jgi:hypothetical protein
MAVAPIIGKGAAAVGGALAGRASANRGAGRITAPHFLENQNLGLASTIGQRLGTFGFGEAQRGTATTDTASRFFEGILGGDLAPLAPAISGIQSAAAGTQRNINRSPFFSPTDRGVLGGQVAQEAQRQIGNLAPSLLFPAGQQLANIGQNRQRLGVSSGVAGGELGLRTGLGAGQLQSQRALAAENVKGQAGRDTGGFIERLVGTPGSKAAAQGLAPLSSSTPGTPGLVGTAPLPAIPRSNLPSGFRA